MTYAVVWQPNARDRLADIWLAAADRKAVTSSSDLIDRQLRQDPHHRGESRDDTARILVEPPLAVVYDVHEDDRLVCILSVRRLPDRRRPEEA